MDTQRERQRHTQKDTHFPVTLNVQTLGYNKNKKGETEMHRDRDKHTEKGEMGTR